MKKATHASLGFHCLPNIQTFQHGWEKKGESETNYMEYMSQAITLIRQKPNHDTPYTPVFCFCVHHNDCDCHNRMQTFTSVSHNVFSCWCAVGVCAVWVTELYIMFINLINGACEVHFSFPFRMSSLKHNNLLPPALN